MDKILIIYHFPCPDGLASAWCFHHFESILFTNVQIDYEPRNYDQPLSLDKYKGYKDIYIVDFSFDAMQLLDLSLQVQRKVILIDHHQTASENLYSFRKNCPHMIDIHLDMNRSGCQMVWDYLTNKCNRWSTKRPWFIDYIADRDLWKWKKPYSKEVNKVLLLDHWVTFKKLDELVSFNSDKLQEFIAKGKDYVYIENKYIRKLAFRTSIGTFLNKRVYFVNSSILVSELGNYLLENDKHNIDYAIIWRYNQEYSRYEVSVRSKKNADSTIICKHFNGGGHKNAAGFSTDQNILSMFTWTKNYSFY